MTEQNYNTAASNMSSGILSFIENEYFKSLIPKQISDTLSLILEYFNSSKALIFSGGKIKTLSLLNIVIWYKFIKSSRKFIIDMVAIWKN